MTAKTWGRRILLGAGAVALLVFVGTFLLSRFPVVPVACGLVVGTIAGAFVLRPVCGLYNRLKPRAPVPEPGFPRALAIVFSAGLLRLSLDALVPLLADGLNVREDEATRIANIGPLPLLSIPVLGLVLRGLLPTTFLRGIMVALLFGLVWIVVGLIVAGVWYAMDGDFRF